MAENIIIFDTTLRDGEQSPGASMNAEEKLRIAQQLDSMGVDVIEAGFAIASKGDADAISAIAKTVKQASVCSLARAVEKDLDAAADAIKDAVKPRIHTFISTSPLHMEHKLKMTPEQVLEAIEKSVSYARNLVPDVDWSPEDATRTEPDFLCKAVEVAIAAGANVINVPDTVGYTLPEEFAALINMLIERVPNSDKAIFSTHCHNDLGLAVANSLAGVQAGARQIECTINGIGERAGNAALEEIVMAIKTRPDLLPYDCGVVTEQITRASRLVSSVTGFSVQNNKAIVGANAFSHESGIHQHGVLANRQTYEIMTPESVGLSQSNLVLGKLSGRAALKSKLDDLGLQVGDNHFDVLFEEFKSLADRKKEIYDEDIIALVEPTETATNRRVRLKHMDIRSRTGGPHEVAMTLDMDGREEHAMVQGNGPVDAAFTAIKQLVGIEPNLSLYQVAALTKGTDAQAEVTVRLIDDEGQMVNGHGTDPDTIVASTRAYIHALNHLLDRQSKGKQDYSDLQRSSLAN